MFRLDPNPTFTAPVLLPRPGEAQPVKVSFTFRHKTWRELNAWLGRWAEFPSDVEFIGEVVETWGPEIAGADGQPMPYSAEALALLLDRFPGSGLAIVRDYRKALGDARVGN